MKKGDTSLYGWKNTRSWIYVEDFCEAFIKVIENKLSLSEIINIGSNDETEVIKLAEIIAKNMNIDPSTIIKKDAPEGSVNRRMPDITKVKKLTGWEPTTTLEDGLAKTVKFYMEEE
jgi:nucleoside-diphosphate-sugar epimerase